MSSPADDRRRRARLDCIEEAGKFMATDPDAAPRVLDRHRPDESGRCRACPPGTGWPCTMVAVARAARVAGEEQRSQAMTADAAAVAPRTRRRPGGLR